MIVRSKYAGLITLLCAIYKGDRSIERTEDFFYMYNQGNCRLFVRLQKLFPGILPWPCHRSSSHNLTGESRLNKHKKKPATLQNALGMSRIEHKIEQTPKVST